MVPGNCTLPIRYGYVEDSDINYAFTLRSVKKGLLVQLVVAHACALAKQA